MFSEEETSYLRSQRLGKGRDCFERGSAGCRPGGLQIKPEKKWSWGN